jgi:hypothetical protein
MTQEEAEALTAGQQIQYWDGRIATVAVAASDPVVSPPDLDPVRKVTIQFDADPDPKPQYRIKSFDFIRAALYTPPPP